MDFSAIRESLPDVGEPPKKVCAVCQAPADKFCGACHQINYCSVEHQKSHWKAHKKNCPPIRIETSQEFGRHYIATRDLPLGTLVMTEIPLLASPSIRSGEDLTCISCCVNFGMNDGHFCSKCEWPFCSAACTEKDTHIGVECTALSKSTVQNKIKIIMSPNLDHLRALNLKQKEPEKWSKMMELQGADKYKSLEEGDDNDKWFAKEVLPILGQIGEEFASDFLKVKGIIKINAFQQNKDTSASTYGTPRRIGGLLYLQTSLFANACFPNTCKLIGPGPEFRLNAITSLEVKKGAILSICYGENTVIPGAIKRQHTGEFGSFICRCPRCVDPTGTELGSMLSAVKCTEKGCKKGYLLPVDPLDMDMRAVWKCNGSEDGCKGASNWENIDGIVSKLEDEMKTHISGERIVDSKRIKVFLDKVRKELHPNHWLVLKFQKDATDRLENYIVRRIKLPETRVELHILMIEDLLRMVEFTAPGSSLAKFNLLAFLYNALNIRFESIGTSSPHSQTGKLLKDFLSKILSVCDELIPIARLYPYGWNEEQLKMIESRRDEFELAMKLPIF